MHTTNDYLYILHFTTPLHHAKHYTGSTTDLFNRLTNHKLGRGSKLTQAVLAAYADSPTHFALGALYTATQNHTIRQIESRIKRQANAPRWCQICNPVAAHRSPPGTVHAPNDTKKNIETLLRQRLHDIVAGHTQ